MKVFSVNKTIAATPEAIWAILVDAPNYPNWDPGMDRIEGRIVPGEKIKVFTKLKSEESKYWIKRHWYNLDILAWILPIICFVAWCSVLLWPF